jgi:hypothetical protein
MEPEILIPCSQEPIGGGWGFPLTINVRMQMVCTFIDTLCKYTTRIMWSTRYYWSAVGCGGRATCSWSRLTVLLLGRLLGVLLFTEACSMGRAVQWSPMKPESWSGWFPLKSSPTCSCRWLHCDLQNVPCDLNVLTDPRQFGNSLTELNWTVSPP